jgi:UDP-N-acetylmuramoyl-tripeptide--D-alanyl-D-alanine ligase
MTKPLWRFDEIVAATGAILDGAGAAQAQGGGEVSGVSIDSRTVQERDLFVAIEGDNRDGHDYVESAFAGGAAGAVVRKDFPGQGATAALFRVDDTLGALRDLGRAARIRMAGKVIAVTGSAGKTGTKEALRLALRPSGTTHASEKSYNNQWGVPLSLARMPADTAYGIFEVGMNHAGEITPLSFMIRPDIAIITTVAPVHIGFFDSEVAIAEAKAEIFAGLRPEGVAILNRDNKHFRLLADRAKAAGARIVSFGSDSRADIRLIDVDREGGVSRVRASVAGRELSYRIALLGTHHVMNSLAVLGAVHAAGGETKAAAESFARLRELKGRGERSRYPLAGGSLMIIDESYNANPASVRAALAAMAQVPRTEYPRRIAVLGDMLELGAQAGSLHLELAGPIQKAGVDKVFACGPMMSALYKSLPTHLKGGYADDSEELAPMLIGGVKPGDVVVIKGSLGSRMGLVVDALKSQLRSVPSAGGAAASHAER